MNISNYLTGATERLQKSGIESARLDAMILLEDILHKDRAWLLANPDYGLSVSQLSVLDAHIVRRTQQEPLAYIRGKVEFYGRIFHVDKTVLVPRPESESFIELLKKHKLNTKSTHILDIGTGSGCIGVTLSLELSRACVTLADIDPKALKIAQKNADRLGADVTLTQANLLSTIPAHFDIIVANLPYVPDNYPVLPPVSFEPEPALFAGMDGMELYRQFWIQVRERPHKPTFILTESLLTQHTVQAHLARAARYYLSETDGLVQLFASMDDN